MSFVEHIFTTAPPTHFPLQRVPCFFGSEDDVKEMRSYYK